MDKATASSYLSDERVTVLTCPHTKFERASRIRAVEAALHKGEMRILYIRVPDQHANKVPQFSHAFPSCEVRQIRHNMGKYLLLSIKPKERSNGDYRPTTEPTPDGTPIPT